MALNPVQVPVSFLGGIETKVDAKQVPTARLLNLENGVFAKGTTIQKRNGYESLGLTVDGQAAPLSGVTRMAARDDELLGFTRTRCYSHDPEANLWVDAGAVFSVAGSNSPAVRTGTMQTMPDHASNGGITAYAWEDSRGGVWWTSVSTSTGRVYRAPEQLDGSGQRPRCVPCGNVIHVYWASGAAVKAVVVNPSTPSATLTPITVVDDLDSSNPTFDAEPTTYAGAPAAMAWAQLGSGEYRAGFVHPSGVLGGPLNGLPRVYTSSGAGVIGPVAITTWKAGHAAKLAVAWRPSANVKVDRFDLSGSLPIVSLSRSSGATLGSGAVNRLTLVMVDDIDATSGNAPVYVAFETGSGQATERFVSLRGIDTSFSGSQILSATLVSRGFQIDGEPFVGFVHDSTYFNTYFFARMFDSLIVARSMEGLADGAPPRAHVSSVHVVGDVASACLPYKERLTSENNDKFTETGLRLIALDFDSDTSHQTAQLGRGLYMAGACPAHYDGHVWTELGFHVGPEYITHSSGGGGSLTNSGVYEYVVWYEWTDDDGEIHRGPTSVGTKITLGDSDSSVTLGVPTLRLTGKAGVRICVARSKNGDASALYRVTSLDPSTAGDPNGYLANDPTVDSVSFTDHMSDSDNTLGEQEPLYTNGGILSNDPAPLGGSVAVGKSRLFFTDPSDPQAIRYSQELEIGYGVEIPPDLVMRCDPYGGAVTALAVMDEMVIVFKERAVYTFGGDGPLANGDASQQGFSAPQLITSDAGCTDPQSIALTPDGLVFKSDKGIYQIDRSRTLSYVGAPAEAYNGQTVRRATLIPDRTQVVFLTDSGKSLMYDYFYKQWSTYTNHAGFDAAVVGGVYHYMRTDGRVFRETPGRYSDDGKSIPLRIETAWIKLQPYLQGFARFWWAHIIGEYKSPHQFRVQYQTDYTPHWSEPAFADATGSAAQTGWIGEYGVAWSGDTDDTIVGTVYGDGNYGDGPYGGVPPGPYQWRIHVEEIGQSIRFRFEDYEDAGVAGPAFELSELLLLGGVKGPVPKPFSSGRSV